MEKLLIINNTEFIEKDLDYSVTCSDKVNEYESESGEKTVEIIREDIHELKVKYSGLLEYRIRQMASVIRPVNTVKFYNPVSGTIKTKIMKADTSRISIDKVYYDYGISAWSLSFSLEEM